MEYVPRPSGPQRMCRQIHPYCLHVRASVSTVEFEFFVKGLKNGSDVLISEAWRAWEHTPSTASNSKIRGRYRARKPPKTRVPRVLRILRFPCASTHAPFIPPHVPASELRPIGPGNILQSQCLTPRSVGDIRVQRQRSMEPPLSRIYSYELKIFTTGYSVNELN